MQKRGLITKEELLDILNKEMQKDYEYKDCIIDEFEERSDNISRSLRIHVQHARHCIDSSGCLQFAFGIAVKAQAKYILK